MPRSCLSSLTPPSQAGPQSTHTVGTQANEHRSRLARRPLPWSVVVVPERAPRPTHASPHAQATPSRWRGLLDAIPARGTCSQCGHGRRRRWVPQTRQPGTSGDSTSPQRPVRVQIFFEQCAVIGDPALMKRVLQTNQKNYAKDLEFSYAPFIVRPRSSPRTPARSRCARARTYWVPGWCPVRARSG